VTLLNPATRSSIGSITCNGSVRACSFTSDGSKLLCSGNEGLVSVQPLFPPPALHILFERELCDSEGATNIIEAHGKYGKGLLALRDWHNDVRNACEYLAKKCGIAVIFLSHIGIQKFKQGPSSDEYCIYNLDLPPVCLPVYVNLVDAVLFLTQEEFVSGNTTDKKGVITKYGKLIQTGDRYLVTENAGNVGYATAKNRYELDSRILVPHGTNPLLNSIKFFSKGNK